MPHFKNKIVFLFGIVILDKFAYKVLLCHCLQRIKLILKKGKIKNKTTKKRQDT